ncbi:MAG: META domain-containing protein [Hyphomonadaceae bacterium]|nr:META domain-containing protein [Hyphomonadaceae bacterium]
MKRIAALISCAVLMTSVAGCQRSAEAPMDLSGRWDVQEIAGASLGEGVDIWMEVDAETGAITGFTGCNNFSAHLSSFGERLAIGDVVEETGDCPTEAAATDEARFLVVLPRVERRIRRGASLELLPIASGSETLLKLRLDEPLGG